MTNPFDRNSSLPSFSVIIVNWNGKDFLPKCLECLANQTLLPDEIIVIDNASEDGSIELVQTDHKITKIIKLASNMGFAAANNIAAEQARGEWLALLNPDAFPEPDWLASFQLAIKEHPETASYTGLLLANEEKTKIDGTGDVYHISGLAWRRAHGQPLQNIPAKNEPVFSACGASAVYRKDIFLENGGFDSDFFCYMEDVDLGFRLRLQGHQCLLVTDAVAFHIGSATTGIQSDFSIYHGHRNLVWVWVKNMPSPILWISLPIHLLLNLISLIWFSIRGQSKTIWSAKTDALKMLPKMLKKRDLIQRQKKVSAWDILKIVNKRPLPAHRR